MITFCRLFLSFLIYSFAGWCCECVYCSVPAKKPVNRGFLTGPVCPVYGFGALAVIHLLRPLGGGILLTFFGGALLTSALEYATSLLLEKLFHLSWWDYSKRRFNLHGRVCLRNSLLFGALCVAAVRFADPLVTGLIDRLPAMALCFTSGALLSVLLLDCYGSVRSVLALNGRLAQISALRGELKRKAEASAAQFKAALEAAPAREERLRDRLEAEYAQREIRRLEAAHRFSSRRLLDAFPRMDSTRHRGLLDEVRLAGRKAREQYQAERRQRKKAKKQPPEKH